METFRDALSRLVLPLGHALAASGISPHLLSASGIVFGSATAWCFSTRHYAVAVALFAVSGMSDVVDGMVARARGLTSPFGSFFDNFCSAYTDSAVFAALISTGLCTPWWGVAALVGTLTRLLTFRLDGLVPVQEAQALRSRFPSALFGKGDRIVLITLGTAFGLINEAIIVIAVGSHLVAAYRCFHLYTWEQATARSRT